MSEIKDSGNRQEFISGAVRDIQKGKGRCDLLPLETVSRYYAEAGANVPSKILSKISAFKSSHEAAYAFSAISLFCNEVWNGCAEDMFLEISKHFEAGAEKYGENNWQKGIPCNRYIDSAVRHYFKFMRGDTDEPHDRAFVWNILCCIWTYEHYGWDLEDITVRNGA